MSSHRMWSVWWWWQEWRSKYAKKPLNKGLLSFLCWNWELEYCVKSAVWLTRKLLYDKGLSTAKPSVMFQISVFLAMAQDLFAKIHLLYSHSRAGRFDPIFCRCLLFMATWKQRKSQRLTARVLSEGNRSCLGVPWAINTRLFFINSRLRKCPGWKSPIQVLLHEVAHLNWQFILCKNKEESVCLVGGGVAKVEVSESQQLLSRREVERGLPGKGEADGLRVKRTI